MKLLGLKTRLVKSQLLIAGIVVFAIACAIVLIRNPLTWSEWTGFGEGTITSRSTTVKVDDKTTITTTENPQSGKTLWDWLDLLGVPLTGAVLGYWFQQFQKKQADKQAALEKEIAESNQQEEVLQEYLRDMSTFLVDKNLIAIADKAQKAEQAKNNQQHEKADGTRNKSVREQIETKTISTPDIETLEEQTELLSAAATVISARTLSVFRRLERQVKSNDSQMFAIDSHVIERKSRTIRFLSEAGVFSKLKVSLRDINLEGCDLWLADLTGANLNDANLNSANIINATLAKVSLVDASLVNASLNGTNLTDANLKGANLNNASLKKAVLTRVNFGGANLTNADLADAELSDTELFDTDLTKVNSWTEEQLGKAKLCFTKLPAGCKLNPNRDCKEFFGVSVDQLTQSSLFIS